MATEFSAMTGFIAPDEKTFAYLRGRPHAPGEDLWDRAVAAWRELVSDEGAVFDREIVIDVTQLSPMVTWGTSPQHAVGVDAAVPTQAQSGTSPEAYSRAIAYMDVAAGTPLDSLRIDAAFIGSCTNSRLSDLRRAAALLRGRRVAEGVRAICVPGSMSVKRAAEAEGLDKVFLAAGFEWRESGCSMCLGMNDDRLSPGERCASTSNRNFEGRQGPGGRSHLLSPALAAAAAIAGRLASIEELDVIGQALEWEAA
jgi:3-isopropylmalate/(R)-2-methylmalate dehydratase large subunit